MDHMLKASINRLIKISFYLFLFTNIAIFGTLFSQNILTQTIFDYNHYPSSNKEIKDFVCNQENNFCNEFDKPFNRLDLCPINDIIILYNIDDFSTKEIVEFKKKLFDEKNLIKSDYKKSNIFVSFKNTEIKNERCIKNYPIAYTIYKIFPIIPDFIANVAASEKYFDPTKQVVNPFFYGETSISNIAKRYPMNFIFKPFLFIASLLMIIYWTYAKKVIYLYDKEKKVQLYYLLGVLSGIFLFLHVFFLGSEIENEIFQKLRKFIIAFFILFELLAQFFLIKKLIKIKDLIYDSINLFFLKLKWLFVIFFLFLTVIIISLLIFLNFPKEVDYIIEWNYFVILSFYYLLTFFLWKKN